MLQYIIKRILIFIPTLFAISLLTFIISINAPGDPVETMLNKNAGGEGQEADKLANEKAYKKLRHQLGLDLPVFYFTITNATVSDTLYKIPKVDHRKTLERLAFMYGNWNDVALYYKNIQTLDRMLYKIRINANNAETLRKLKNLTSTLFYTYDAKKINSILNQIEFNINKNKYLDWIRAYFQAVKNTYSYMLINQNPYKKFIPAFHWYGINNQYHLWMFGDKPWFSSQTETIVYRSAGFIRGDFGISYQDKRPVSSVIWDALRWTFILSTSSIILAYLIAIPLGVKSAVKKGTRTERIITTVLFMLYSLPNFWIATMLIIFLCSPDYVQLFPAFGVGQLSSNAPFWDRFLDTSYHLVLPLICWTYGSLAFISRQMRGGMLNVLGQDFIRTARAKGVEEKKIIWKHAFRNSLIPIITMFANIFPLAISGSFVIEFIFSIPGMGKLTLDALFARNYPVVFTVMMFTAILTLIGTLVADITYAIVDPRISFSKKK